jgi:RimJ/RimL family protein N-acetyltransferase
MPLPPIASIPTPRLTLRPVAEADLPDLLEINGDPEVTRFLPYPTWSSLDDGRAWFKRMEALVGTGLAVQLVAVRSGCATVVGTVLLFKYEEPSARLELGYVLGRKYWGQGLMHEAIRAACGHAFSALAVRRIEAEVNPTNLASNRVLARAGFSLEGTLRKRWVAKGSAPYDTNIYGLLADEFQN